MSGSFSRAEDSLGQRAHCGFQTVSCANIGKEWLGTSEDDKSWCFWMVNNTIVCYIIHAFIRYYYCLYVRFIISSNEENMKHYQYLPGRSYCTTYPVFGANKYWNVTLNRFMCYEPLQAQGCAITLCHLFVISCNILL